MSPLQDDEELLDERIHANGHNGEARATAQQPVLDEKKENLSTVATRHQSPAANLSNEKTEISHPLRHFSEEDTADGTAARDKSDEPVQTPPEQLCPVPENDSSALDVHPEIAPDDPIHREKIGPQDLDDGQTFPEGGLRAWLVVLGSFSGMTASFGILNSAGTFQAYLSTHQLAHESPSAVGWIFSLFAFLTFFCGVQIGPVFDAYGPRWLVFAGTVCLLGGMMGVAESTSECW